MSLGIGRWGGSGIRLDVTAAGGNLEFNCALGSISEPIVLDGAGNFQAAGSHTLEAGGPPGPGAPQPSPRPARFRGHVAGNQMELTVTLAEGGTSLGTYSLTLGTAPELDKCV
jgi:hypothetical protein